MELFLRGLVLGFSIAAPVGPIGRSRAASDYHRGAETQRSTEVTFCGSGSLLLQQP